MHKHTKMHRLRTDSVPTYTHTHTYTPTHTQKHTHNTPMEHPRGVLEGLIGGILLFCSVPVR